MPGPQRRADRAVQAHDLVGVERVRRAEWAEPRAPERLVRVDVPQAGDDALVEEHRLERRPSSCELRCEPARVKRGPSGSGPFFAARYGSSSTPSSTSQVPNRRTSRYTTRVPSSSSITARSWLAGSQPKPPVMRRCTSRARPLSRRSDEVLPAPLDGDDASPSSSSATSNRSFGRVSRGSRISTRSSTRPSSRGASWARIVSTSGSSGISRPPQPRHPGSRSRVSSRRAESVAEAARTAAATATTASHAQRPTRGPGSRDDVEQDPVRVQRLSPRSRTRRGPPRPPAAADSSSRAWTSARTSALRDVLRRASRGRRRRPRGRSRRPSCGVRPRARARRCRSRAPKPADDAVARRDDLAHDRGAVGSAARSGSPPCARIQRSYAASAEPSAGACSARAPTFGRRRSRGRRARAAARTRRGRAP